MAYSTEFNYKHEVKWTGLNRRLNNIGFWVRWQHAYDTDSYKYGIGLKGERQPMGIYNDEDTAQAMVKMILSNDEHEGG